MNSDIDQIHFLVVHIGKADCFGDWNYKNISSPFTRIYYVTEGHAQLEFQDRIQDLTPGNLYIIPAFTQHNCICGGKFCHYYVHIYNEAGHDILEDWELPTEIPSGKETLDIVRRLYDLCPGMELTQADPRFYDNSMSLNQRILKNKQRELHMRIESRGIIYILLSAFLRHGRQKQYVGDRRITRLLEFIRAHIEDRPDLDALASFSCMSKDHLTRIFKREMQMTPLQYINKKKIEKAQLELIGEKTPVKEIAYKLGFEDQTYFNRIFKKNTGMTPTEYRKRY